MHAFRFIVGPLLVSSLLGCGPVSSSADGGQGSTGGGGGTVGSTGGGGGGGAAPVDAGGETDLQRVQAFCTATLLPRCAPNWFTSQDQCVSAMSARPADLCEDAWDAEVACLSSLSASQWGCDSGSPRPLATGCAANYGAGWLCRTSINKPTCFGASCQFNVDCASDKCDSATGHCVQPSADCPNLPCRFDDDCPDRYQCNSALMQCLLR
jgi:hypothetical protein